MNDDREERGRIIHFVFEVILKLVQKENEVNEVDVKLSVVLYRIKRRGAIKGFREEYRERAKEGLEGLYGGIERGLRKDMGWVYRKIGGEGVGYKRI